MQKKRIECLDCGESPILLSKEDSVNWSISCRCKKEEYSGVLPIEWKEDKEGILECQSCGHNPCLYVLKIVGFKLKCNCDEVAYTGSINENWCKKISED